MTTIEQTYENLGRLSAINKELETRCFYLVFGGFAIDGILGKFTRPHKDIDLLCFRRDFETVKDGLNNVGFEMIEVAHHKDAELIYKLVSSDKTCTCHILDEVLDNCFEISFYHFLRQRFPLYLLALQSVTLHNIMYPITTKEFLYILKEQENVLLNEIKKNNPEKYLKWIKRHKLVKRDIKLLKAIT
ncbi:MAG: hypothetical protein AB1333_04670 [Patescibacteria group bacterium]